MKKRTVLLMLVVLPLLFGNTAWAQEKEEQPVLGVERIISQPEPPWLVSAGQPLNILYKVVNNTSEEFNALPEIDAEVNRIPREWRYSWIIKGEIYEGKAFKIYPREKFEMKFSLYVISNEVITVERINLNINLSK